MKQTYVSYVEKNITQKKMLTFLILVLKVLESLIASYHNGVQQQLISSTFEKMKLLKNRKENKQRW